MARQPRTYLAALAGVILASIFSPVSAVGDTAAGFILGAAHTAGQFIQAWLGGVEGETFNAIATYSNPALVAVVVLVLPWFVWAVWRKI